jgi:hypothetical protein
VAFGPQYLSFCPGRSGQGCLSAPRDDTARPSSENGAKRNSCNCPGSKSVTGRDHHPNAISLWLAGGSIKGGHVIGKTDDIAWNVAEDPVHVLDLHVLILHLFGFEDTRLTYRLQGRDYRLTDFVGRVLPQLFA